MIRTTIVLLALLAGPAFAQPGATPTSGEMQPVPPQPQPQQAVPPQQPPQEQTPQNQDALLDQAIARAREAAPSIVTIAQGTLRRARRSIAIGPTVGTWGAAYITPGETDLALTVGIGLETFKIPVMPDMETIQALIKERVKAQAKERVKQFFQGRDPDPVQLDQLVAQVYEDVRKEILGLENVRPKTLEYPSLTVAFEADRRFGADRWLGRTRVGIGIWKLTFALSASFGKACRGDGCDARIRGFIGPEFVLHIIPTKNPRANVIDVFLRGDFQATGRADTTTYDQLVIGARYLVDVI